VHAALTDTSACLALAVTLLAAVVRPRGISEAAVAVPAAGVLVAFGVETGTQAVDRLKVIGPTVGFLAAILIFGHLCARAEVFEYLGALVARTSHGDPRRLLALVVALAAAVTAVLTLDATVVLLTPVILTTVARLGVTARPHAYSGVRIANSGSLLLPVSNLTNLLAFAACGLSFGRFAALMALPWLVTCALEWLSLRVAFRRDLGAMGAMGATGATTTSRPVAPRYALGALALTVTGIVLTSSLHVAPAWAAVAGCLLLLARERQPVGDVIREASPGFCLFVLALAVTVDAVTRHGLGSLLRHAIPAGSGLGAIAVMAFLAAALANVVNNLPATLALALAMLLGVNIGPNATYGGSLATLLWRRLLPAEVRPRAREFHLLGIVTVPLVLAAACLTLWVSLQVIGA
jgi:arsenical pump membrane protein